MADIFISYAREDRAEVAALAEALSQAGYSLWWDKNLTGGARYLDATEHELKSARAVLVVWTRASIASHWVADEAAVGRDSQKLVPITLDGAIAPLGFRQFQVIDFSGWKSGEGEAFAELCIALSRLAGQPAQRPDSPAAEPAASRVARPRRLLTFAGLSLLAIALLAAGGMMLVQTGNPDLNQPTRLAFFGFTAGRDDATAAGVAEAATTEVFEALSSQQVKLAARSETVGIPADQQFARARALGARFALSGDVRTVPGKAGELQISVRLEDGSTRSTIWEEGLTAAAAQPRSAAVQAATRAADTADCLIAHYVKIARRARDDELLGPLATYCSGFRGVMKPEARSALETLVSLAPDNVDLMGAFARIRIQDAWFSKRATGEETSLQEARAVLERSRKLGANEPAFLTAAYFDEVMSAKPYAEIEQMLRSGLAPSADPRTGRADRPILLGYLGAHVFTMGRFGASAGFLQTASQVDPLSEIRRIYYVSSLAALNRYDAPQALYEYYTRWPSTVSAEILLSNAVLSHIGDSGQVLASPPGPIPAGELACWREIDMALRSPDARQRMQGVVQVRSCLKELKIGAYSAVQALSLLGDIDAAFALADTPQFDLPGWALEGYPPYPLFLPTTRAMRADPRFLPLMEKLRFMDYWRTTASEPDLCAAEAAPFCLELRRARAPR